MKLKLCFFALFGLAVGVSSVSAYDFMCSDRDGFVWSRISGKCVQEICPNDSTGRDANGDCSCPPYLNPKYSGGFLTACVEPPVEKMVLTPTIEVATNSPVAIIVVDNPDASSSLGSVVLKKETRSSTAMPNTATIIMVIAMGLGYWLYKLPPVNKK